MISTIYTEYDDIGVVSLHKALASESREFVLYQDNIVDISFRVNSDSLSNHLLDSPFFAAYIGYAWTYAPGQYFIYPLIIDESDGFWRKLIAGRSISAAASSLALLVFFYFAYLLENKKIKLGSLIGLSLVAFSFNTVLYAHHMSPYSMYAFIAVLSLLLFWLVLEGRLPVTRFFGLTGFLTVFSYLTMFMMPAFTAAIILKGKEFSIKAICRKFFPGGAIYLLFFVPLFVF